MKHVRSTKHIVEEIAELDKKISSVGSYPTTMLEKRDALFSELDRASMAEKYGQREER
jgi:hypothetical protein